MRVILSRKGFDTGSGGYASPILNGRPVSLPIPQDDPFGTPYADLGLGEVVERVTRGKVSPQDIAHHDPQFLNGTVLFGQSGAAQSHLNNQGVVPGDVFLFFGLFRDYENPTSMDYAPHHRIFGWMIADVKMSPADAMMMFPEIRHPHLDPGREVAEDTVWLGRGGLAKTNHPQLRLTENGRPPSFWSVPGWMREAGLSYHAAPDRWHADGVRAVARGQEFVIGEHPQSPEWAMSMIEACEAEPSQEPRPF